MGGPYYVSDGSSCRVLDREHMYECLTHEQPISVCKREKDYLRNIKELLDMLNEARINSNNRGEYLGFSSELNYHLFRVQQKYKDTVFP